MIILGIDPGSRITGYGVIESHAQTMRYIASGCIRTESAGSDLILRINVLSAGIREVLDTFKPDEIAIEQVFVNVNPSATLKLGQARGAILAILGLSQKPIFEYTALQVKQAVVGQGKAKKEQVQHMVVHLLKLLGTPQADASDALAVAMTHAIRQQTLVGRLGLNRKIKGGRLI